MYFPSTPCSEDSKPSPLRYTKWKTAATAPTPFTNPPSVNTFFLVDAFRPVNAAAQAEEHGTRPNSACTGATPGKPPTLMPHTSGSTVPAMPSTECFPPHSANSRTNALNADIASENADSQRGAHSLLSASRDSCAESRHPLGSRRTGRRGQAEGAAGNPGRHGSVLAGRVDASCRPGPLRALPLPGNSCSEDRRGTDWPALSDHEFVVATRAL